MSISSQSTYIGHHGNQPLSLNNFGRRCSIRSAGMQLQRPFRFEDREIYTWEHNVSWHQVSKPCLSLSGNSTSACHACRTRPAGQVLHSACETRSYYSICSSRRESWHCKHWLFQMRSWS